LSFHDPNIDRKYINDIHRVYDKQDEKSFELNGLELHEIRKELKLARNIVYTKQKKKYHLKLTNVVVVCLHE